MRCTRLEDATGDGYGLKVHASAPLGSGDEVWGILNVAGSDWDAFSPRGLELLNNVGIQLGAALQRARFFDLLRERRIHEQAALLDLSQQLLGRLELTDLMSYLVEQVKENYIPQHVAIIMDGNRRFASELGLSPDAGHLFGKDKLEEVLEWCFELEIKNLTVYAFSTENFDRDIKEVETLMDLCKTELNRALKDSRIHKNKVKIRVLGHLDSLPEDISKSAQYIMDETKKALDKETFLKTWEEGRRMTVQEAFEYALSDRV